MKHSTRREHSYRNIFGIVVLIGVIGGILMFRYTRKSVITQPQIVSTPHIAPNGYYVRGNAIYDSGGHKHMFHGVSRPSLEWNAAGEHLSEDDYRHMKTWGFNMVRVPLNQQFWLDDTDGYKQRVRQNIKEILSLDMDVILDLHWSDRGDSTRDASQQRMADDRSLTFWGEIAGEYKTNGRVLFELYNEPHDIDWGVWQYGGDSGDGFQTVGMQDLYDAVRSAGSDNIVIINGLNWAFDLKGAGTHRIDGYNIVYSIHIYDQPGKRERGEWDSSVGTLMAQYPVMITEFGNFDCKPEFYRTVLSYAVEHNMSWVSWAWYPGGCGFPGVISDWDGTPNAMGEAVQSYLPKR